MKRISFPALATALLCCAVTQAQQYQFAGFGDVESAISGQQAELEELRAQFASFQEQALDPAQTPVAEPVMEECGVCCGPTWSLSPQLVIMTGGLNESGATNRFDQEVGYRLIASRDDGCGNGVRIRYLDWDTNAGDDNDFTTLDVMDIRMFDVEGYLTFPICCGTSIEVSGGVRYLHYHENFDIGTGGLDATTLHGWGPVIGADLTHRLNDCWAVYGLSRVSVVRLEGRSTGGRIRNQASLLNEVEVGVQYNGVWRPFRIGIAGQTLNGTGGGMDAEVSNIGFTFACGGGLGLPL